MKKSRMFILIALSLVLSVLVLSIKEVVGLNQYLNPNKITELESIIPQEVLGDNGYSQKVTKVYHKNELIGILHDYKKIEALLSTVDSTLYQEEFPDSLLSLGEDVYLVEEESYFNYENVDNLIVNYIMKEDLFAIEAYKIEFSNGATVYVKNLEEFESAKRKFLFNFVDEEDLTLLDNGRLPNPIPANAFGDRTVGYSILETYKASNGFASLNNILKSESEIIKYLSYGYKDVSQDYVVVEYDTIEYIAYKTGLLPQQLVTINNPKLTSVNQLVEVGETLNTTYFDSPITVQVTKEATRQVPVYAQEPEIRYDSTLNEGVSRVIIDEETGYNRVTYKETYINGIVQPDPEIIETSVIKAPVRQVVVVGSKVVPGFGTGTFRIPVDNATVSCGWYCYAGHRAIDYVDRYNRYGPVYAADRGVVVREGYSGGYGNYIVIDHNNGFQTLYAHLYTRAYFNVGAYVNKGEVIGRIGSTGWSTGPHLHLEVILHGEKINPCYYVSCPGK